MDFSAALTALKSGAILYRGIWRTNNRTALSLYKPVGAAALFVTHATSDAEFPYTPTIEDVLAEDWVVA